jgi:hypothetical protein
LEAIGKFLLAPVNKALKEYALQHHLLYNELIEARIDSLAVAAGPPKDSGYAGHTDTNGFICDDGYKPGQVKVTSKHILVLTLVLSSVQKEDGFTLDAFDLYTDSECKKPIATIPSYGVHFHIQEHMAQFLAKHKPSHGTCRDGEGFRFVITYRCILPFQGIGRERLDHYGITTDTSRWVRREDYNLSVDGTPYPVRNGGDLAVNAIRPFPGVGTNLHSSVFDRISNAPSSALTPVYTPKAYGAGVGVTSSVHHPSQSVRRSDNSAHGRG